MKKIIVTSLILIICCTAQAVERKTYFNDDIGPKINYTTGTSIRPYQVDNNTYHAWNNDTQSYKTYTRSGDNIYSSNNSRYTQYGNTIQNDSTGERYYLNGSSVEPLY